MTPAVTTLCDRIRGALAEDPAGPGVARLLEDYAGNEGDWSGYRLFNDGFYARNLVEVCDLFELIVICWKEGQTSPIHNHAGQHCWMAVLEGTIEETHYAHPEAGAGGPLAEVCTQTFPSGSVAYIHDDIALHVIRPAAGSSAVSLHLYSRPIKACNIYCPNTGRIEQKHVSYYSVEGRPVAS